MIRKYTDISWNGFFYSSILYSQRSFWEKYRKETSGRKWRALEYYSRFIPVIHTGVNRFPLKYCQTFSYSGWIQVMSSIQEQEKKRKDSIKINGVFPTRQNCAVIKLYQSHGGIMLFVIIGPKPWNVFAPRTFLIQLLDEW